LCRRVPHRRKKQPGDEQNHKDEGVVVLRENSRIVILTRGILTRGTCSFHVVGMKIPRRSTWLGNDKVWGYVFPHVAPRLTSK
jgi:hypothetical protein